MDVLQDGLSNGDGTYYLDPNGTGADAYYCDMQNGGWTGISFPQADTLLGGIMVAVNSASIEGIDPVNGPYTRDASGLHTYHYTFEYLPGFSEFKFLNYEIKANSGGSNTTDLNLNDFVMTSWNTGYGGTKGDVSFGTAAQSGPVANCGQTMASTTTATVQHTKAVPFTA